MNTIPWVEKYRPTTLGDINGHDYIMRTLKKYGGIHYIPNLLFYGPAGTGKTSTILAMARDYYSSSTIFKSMTMELNASDERDIGTIREKINSFACSASVLTCDSHKIVKLVILDEADALTVDAQSSLRTIMESFSTRVKFCLCCNYVNKISPSLQSRCTKFRFQGVGVDGLVAVINKISESENMEIDKEASDAIISISNGDTRRVINIMQSLYLSSDKRSTYTCMDVYKCTGEPLDSHIEELLDICIRSNMEYSYKFMKDMLENNGYSLSDIVNKIGSKIAYSKSGIKNYGLILQDLSDIEYNLSVDSSSIVQLGYFISIFHQN